MGPHLLFHILFHSPATHGQRALRWCLLTDGNTAHSIPTVKDLSPGDPRKSPPLSPPLRQDFQRLAQIGGFLLSQSRIQRNGFQGLRAKPLHRVQNRTITKTAAKTFIEVRYFLLPSHSHLSCTNFPLSLSSSLPQSLSPPPTPASSLSVCQIKVGGGSV